MQEKKLFTIAVVTLIPLFILLLIATHVYSRWQSNIFTISKSEVLHIVSDFESECDYFNECHLIPGDILLRKLSTSRTRFLESFADIYFTHTAMYIGDGKIIEAIGRERIASEEIQTIILTDSDWATETLATWAIIRPNYTPALQTAVITTLKKIATNDAYRFGFYSPENKRFSCADLLLHQLHENGVISEIDFSQIITPDYLFWLATEKPSSLQLISYGNTSP